MSARGPQKQCPVPVSSAGDDWSPFAVPTWRVKAWSREGPRDGHRGGQIPSSSPYFHTMAENGKNCFFLGLVSEHYGCPKEICMQVYSRFYVRRHKEGRYFDCTLYSALSA